MRPCLPTLGGRHFQIGKWLSLLLMHVRSLLMSHSCYACACSCTDGWWFLALCVLDLVFCAGDIVLIVGLCFFFLILCLANVYFSTLGTTGVDIVDNYLVGCVIDLV